MANEKRKSPIFGIGINDLSENTRGTKVYLVWKSMLSRCYSDYTHKGNPTYIGCEVCQEWHRLSVFKKWFDENYKEGCELDKDILVRGNRIYSPDTCCFVPRKINRCFSGHKRNKGLAPGVWKQCNRYNAEFRGGGKRQLRSFANLEDALAYYSKCRNEYLQSMAKSSYDSGEIDFRLYTKILSYAV